MSGTANIWLLLHAFHEAISLTLLAETKDGLEKCLNKTNCYAEQWKLLFFKVPGMKLKPNLFLGK